MDAKSYHWWKSPETAINKLLKTLDIGMINAEWESMNEVVLAAGRNEEGQQIIPLSYTVPVSVYHPG